MDILFNRMRMYERRTKRGLTISQAASIAGCKTGAWHEWELGLDLPSDWWLDRIAFALRCTPNELMLVETV